MPLPLSNQPWPPDDPWRRLTTRFAQRWANETTEIDQREHRVRVPMVADVAAAAASLLFGRPPRILGEVETLAVDTDLPQVLAEAAETASALGGVWIRVGWDSAMSDRPMLSVVSPLHSTATFRWGHVVEAQLAEVVDDVSGGVRWYHLEHHEPGRVTHALYRGTTTSVGSRVPLAHHALTADLDEVVTIPGGRMSITYVPNVWPARQGWHWGRADLDGCWALLDALDETFSSWSRDVRLGQGRLLVPFEFLEGKGRGQGRAWSTTQEVFTKLNMQSGTKAVEMSQFAIRANDHRMTAAALIERVIITAGYSPETFGLREGGPIPSAAALRVREERSYRTRDRKWRYWREPVLDVLGTLAAVSTEVFGRPVSTEGMGIAFRGTDESGPVERSQVALQLSQSGAASLRTLVSLVSPDATATEVDTEVARILAERPTPPPASAVP